MTVSASKLICVGVGALFLHALQPGILAGLPVAWTHDITPSCHWTRKPWLERLDGDLSPRLTPEALAQRRACLQGRGLKSPTPSVSVLLRKWPSGAELAALSSRQEAEDETPDRSPLLAAVGAGALQLTAGH